MTSGVSAELGPKAGGSEDCQERDLPGNDLGGFVREEFVLAVELEHEEVVGG